MNTGKRMELLEFETKIRKIRAENGWNIEFELVGGLWIFRVFNKETGKELGKTGSTGLEMIFSCLEYPFDKCLWV